MFSAWQVGKLFGIPVYVHWSCLLLVVLALGGAWEQSSLPHVLASAALVPAIFTCVLLHEFGHCLTARAYGIRTRDITLCALGGVARLEGLGKRPWEELFVALAGPAVNVAIAFVLTLVFLPFGMGLVPRELNGETTRNLAGSFVLTLLAANLLLGFFNLLPAFPMDGGRVLRSLLQVRLGRLRATELAARIGLVLAVLIPILGPAGWYLLSGEIQFMPILVFVALFVAYAGQRELWAVRRVEEERARQEEEEAIPEVLPVEVAAPTPSRNGTE